jgi:alpha/beta superfamily hydrolase
MHTKVVHRAAKLLAARFSLAALRFNFRGVGASAGTHDDGRGEVDDLLAAVRHARSLGEFAAAGRGPFVLAGFSFGSVCAIEAAGRLAAAGAPPDALLLLGVPLLRWDRAGARALAGVPVAWVQGGEDEFGGAELARATAERLGWALAVVAGADHFFAGRLDAFEETAAREVGILLAEARRPGERG